MSPSRRPRARLQILADSYSCGTCAGTGIAQPPVDEGERIDAMIASLKKFHEEQRLAAMRLPAPKRDAEQWSYIDAQASSASLGVAILDGFTAERDASLAEAARRYLAAVE